LGDVAPVDGQCDASDVAGAVAAEPEDGLGDLIGCAEPVDGLACFGLVAVEFSTFDHGVDHGGADRAGADGIDSDTAGAVFEGDALGEADDAVLGGVVNGAAGLPTRPPRKEQLTIAPLPCSRMWRSSCFTLAQIPRKLMPWTRSNCSALSSAASVGGGMIPALL
jgi:hypothetical protein